jgi:glycosidase
VNRDLLTFYRDAIQFRRDTPALRSSHFETLQADDERSTFAYVRGDADAPVLVVLNRSSEAHSLRLPLPDSLRGTYDISLSAVDNGTRVQSDGAALLLELPATSGVALTKR